MWRLFLGPIVASFLVFLAVFWWGGAAALSLAFFLTLLEVSLSFDNAVVNAKVLTRMEEVWRHRFLTWGMVVAVFGTRLVLPILIVAIAAGISPLVIAYMLFADPSGYSRLIDTASPVIRSFGGAFLMMVALRYFFDEAKNVHWIHFVESRLTLWGRVQAIEVLITLVAVLITSWAVPGDAARIVTAGSIGIILFILMEGLVHLLGASSGSIGRVGVGLFVYLNLLDAAFSLDGVIGAFALTTNILVIIAGLGIGAYFVRTLTIFFVRKRTLATLMYLEHGAYWAIAALALCMFINVATDLPGALVGTISILFIGAAYFSTLREHKLRSANNL